MSPSSGGQDHFSINQALPQAVARAGVDECDLIRAIRDKWPRNYHRMNSDNVLAYLVDFKEAWTEDEVHRVILEMIDEEPDGEQRKYERVNARRIKPL